MKQVQQVQRYFASGDNVFFTSDTHFCHSNVIGFCKRPFSSVEEMDEALIKAWNEVVPPNGIVFHLGDFAFGDIEKWRPIVSKLNGDIVLIKGNHDIKQLKSQVQFDELFKFSFLEMRIEIEKRKIILNHFPLLCYDGVYRKPERMVYNLHGHIHTMKDSIGKDFERYTTLALPSQYDCGVDMAPNYAPIPWKFVDERVKYQIDNNVNIRHWLE